jgi:peroxiredoxin
MDTLTQIGDRLPALTLFDVDGGAVELDGLLDKPLAFPLVRYYGCMPCRAFLVGLDDARPRLEAAGLRVVGVGGAADYQARHLMDHGVGYPLLLDPSHSLYKALDIHHIRWHALLRPIAGWRYLRAARGARQGRITDHPLQAPGFAIIDTDRTVAFLHRGETLGDYPSIDQVLAAARTLAAHPRP